MPSVIFLLLTPFVWRKLVHPLERVGWISGIIIAAVSLLVWVVGEVPIEWRLSIAAAAFVILAATAGWSATKKESSEQDDRRREDIWKAIKKWVDLPIVRFRDKQDTFPLAEKPPELAVEIEECLSQNYLSVYASLQKLRQEYFDWKNENPSDKFVEYVDGEAVIHVTNVHDYNEMKCGRLWQLHSQLVEQIKSEILAKHHTRLKC